MIIRTQNYLVDLIQVLITIKTNDVIMKKYYNFSTKEWYVEGQVMTRAIENGLFSGVPSEGQLTAWGFKQWIEPAPTPEQLLAQAKANKVAELEAYNQSDAVDSFTINGQSMWLTVEERQQIATQISANEAVGRTDMTRWFGGHSFTFPLATWKQMLVALEVYAGDAINVTEAHRAAIGRLTTVEDVANYDFTEGYPQRQEF